MKKIYYFTINKKFISASCGDWREVESEEFENLLQAFKAWKQSRQTDGYRFRDFEMRTSDLRAEWVPDGPTWHKHGLMIGHEPTEAERKEFREFKKDFVWEESWEVIE